MSNSQRDLVEFSDADWMLRAYGDQTKRFKIDLSGMATATLLAPTVPNITAGAFEFDGAGITTVASATSTLIGASPTRDVSISGTTTITSFDTVAAGTYRQGKFEGALTLTHNATSLIIPGAANITTAAGDTFGAESLGSGNWRILWYQKATGGSIVAPASGFTSLGTITTTSGSSQALSSLTLTTYKFMLCIINAVSGNNASSALTQNSVAIVGATGSNTFSGSLLIDLSNGVGIATTARSTGSGSNSIIATYATGLSTGSTSITFTIAAGSFNAGSIKVYAI